MNAIRSILTGAVVLVSMLAWPGGIALAQQRSLAEQVTGTWRYVAVDIVHPDGTRTPLYGPNPQGLAMFDGHGHYLLMTSRADLPRFGSSDRAKGTDDENRAVVHGVIAHFGTYAVNEAERTIVFNIEGSTFPNWNGTTQRRPVSVHDDELRWATPASSGGGTAEVVLKRTR